MDNTNDREPSSTASLVFLVVHTCATASLLRAESMLGSCHRQIVSQGTQAARNQRTIQATNRHKVFLGYDDADAA